MKVIYLLNLAALLNCVYPMDKFCIHSSHDNLIDLTKESSKEDKSYFSSWLFIRLWPIFISTITIEILVLEWVCLSWSSKHICQKNLVKSLLISNLYKVIYYKRTFLQDSTKPLFTTPNRLETSWKNSPLFSTCFF
jgi:hypothetical protein